jgi:SAM-dependent methyltransferase
MTIEDDSDLPYGENFHDVAEAKAWANAAGQKRPFRPMIFDHFVAAVAASKVAAPRVLELGSGPGFLAEHVLERCPSIASYTLLDFSEPMLALSQQRLWLHTARTRFTQADFKSDAWPAAAGGPFDFVFSMQAVHELRHKRHAPRLYEQVRPLLSPEGRLVICDHLPDGAHTERHRLLYLTVDEYLAMLPKTGFANVELVWTGYEMAVYQASAA